MITAFRERLCGQRERERKRRLLGFLVWRSCFVGWFERVRVGIGGGELLRMKSESANALLLYLSLLLLLLRLRSRR